MRRSLFERVGEAARPPRVSGFADLHDVGGPAVAAAVFYLHWRLRRDATARGLALDEPVDARVRGGRVEARAVELQGARAVAPSRFVEADGQLRALRVELQARGVGRSIEAGGFELGARDALPARAAHEELDGLRGGQLSLPLVGRQAFGAAARSSSLTRPRL